MTASPSLKRPRTEALLAIDALPVWGAPAGVPQRPMSRRPIEPSRPGPTAPIHQAPRTAEPVPAPMPMPEAAPSPTAPAERRHGRAGGWSIGLGAAAGMIAIWPFLDLRPPETAAPAGLRRYPPAALQPAVLVQAATAALIAPAPAASLAPADAAPLPAGDPSARPVEALFDEAAPDLGPLAQTRLVQPSEAAWIAPRPIAAHPAPDSAIAERAALEPGGGAGPAAVPRPRIVIHHTAGERPAADAVARRLNRSGLDVAFRQVPFAIRQREIRVFAAQDSARAARVAAAASPGSPLRVADFRHYRPSPSPGLVEIWVR